MLSCLDVTNIYSQAYKNIFWIFLINFLYHINVSRTHTNAQMHSSAET